MRFLPVNLRPLGSHCARNSQVTLRAAGVSYEDRQDLLGHKSDRMTTHYSAPELAKLLEAANAACERRRATVLRVVEAKRGQKVRQKAGSALPALTR